MKFLTTSRIVGAATRVGSKLVKSRGFMWRDITGSHIWLLHCTNKIVHCDRNELFYVLYVPKMTFDLCSSH